MLSRIESNLRRTRELLPRSRADGQGACEVLPQRGPALDLPTAGSWYSDGSNTSQGWRKVSLCTAFYSFLRKMPIEKSNKGHSSLKEPIRQRSLKEHIPPPVVESLGRYMIHRSKWSVSARPATTHARPCPLAQAAADDAVAADGGP